MSKKSVAPALTALLADTYTLAIKTQNYHWNVTGNSFFSLHKLFEEQYDALFEAADELAERLRALGHHAPGGLSEFAKLTSMADAKTGLSAEAMLKDLAKSHEQAATTIRTLIAASETAGDDATNDMAIGRLEAHDKMRWMLTASVK